MTLSLIQNQILTKLLKSKELRYMDCIPENVDKDLFNYHFKFLQDRGYILKKDDSYSLTNFGKKYVQKLDAKGDYKSYFRFSVLIYVINDQREILLHKRLRHPYYGDIGVISGKVLYGEKIEEAAKRKVFEETGLLISTPKLIGVHRKTRYDKNGEIIEDTLYHCCLAKEFTGELKEKTEFGENFWSSFKEAESYEGSDVAGSPKGAEVLERIEKNDLRELFFFQEDQILQTY